METLPETPLDPLAAPGVRRLLLSEAASRYLEASGVDCFQIIGKSSYPAAPGRWAIYLVPCSLEVGTLASGVLFGTHTAKRKPTSSSKATPSPDRAATLTE